MEKYQQYRQHNSSDLCNKTAQQTFRCIIYVILAAGSMFIQEGGGPYVRSSIKIESEWL